MSKTKWYSAVFLSVLLLALIAAPVSAATGVSQKGRGIAAVGDNLFVSLSDDNDYQLSRLPADGGSLTKIDSQNNIEDLIAVGDSLYYIRLDQPSYQIVRADAEGSTLQPLIEDEKIIEKLSFYDGILYCLADGLLTLVDPDSGDRDVLNPDIKITDYVIVNDVIFYISQDKVKTFSVEANGETIEGTGGILFSMDLTGGNSEQLVDDASFTDIAAYGNYLYLHNMADGYATQAGSGNIWMEGKLYRLNIQTNQMASMNIPYDWASYPTAYGMVVYTDKDVSLYPLSGGAAKKLYTPEEYATVTASDTMAYVYEYTKGVLTALPLDGSAPKTLYSGGPIVDPDEEAVPKEVEYQVDEEGNFILDDDGNPIPLEPDEPETTESTESSTSGSSSGSSSSSGKTGGYIFSNSSTKKLTRSQILNISKSKWGYARNEIYARHGYQFKTKKYRDYFNGKSWYKPGGFSTKSLNKTEWYNMNLIRDMEIEYGLLDESGRSTGSSSSSSSSGRIKLSKNVFPNSSTKKLKASQVKKLSKEKLATARNEILARHGYPFKQSKWVNYFKKIGWKKRSSYSYSKLNSIEKYNIELIKKYE